MARFAAGARDLRRRTEAARAALHEATATETVADGAVTVTVDADGVLTGLHLAPSAADLGLEALARTVVSATRTGRAAALERAERDVAALVGEDNAAVGVLRRQRAELEPTPDEDADGGFTGRGR